jgi:hypothetical protein
MGITIARALFEGEALEALFHWPPQPTPSVLHSAAMRLAVLADVHGNPLALEAVLADVASVGVDGCLVLGDLAAGGYDPSGAVERLRALRDAEFVRGNGEAMLTGGDHVRLVQAAAGNPEAAARALVLAAVLSWTHGHVAARGHLDWLSGLPLERRITLPDGTRLLASHAAPGSGLHDFN